MTIPAPATALPWEWGKDRRLLFRDNLKHDGKFSSSTILAIRDDDAFRPSEQDAAYLERACNSFPALVAALQGYLADCSNDECERCIAARAALSLALGEQ